jgi:hypothetical protein
LGFSWASAAFYWRLRAFLEKRTLLDGFEVVYIVLGWLIVVMSMAFWLGEKQRKQEAMRLEEQTVERLMKGREVVLGGRGGRRGWAEASCGEPPVDVVFYPHSVEEKDCLPSTRVSKLALRRRGRNG